MGFLDRLAGRDTRPQSPEADAEPTTSAAAGSSEVLKDTAPTLAAFQQPSNRLYDPYEGISSALGGKKAVFQLPEGPEFVFQDEAVAKRRGWSENLQFYTGLGYLGGGATGFAIGGYRYLNLPADPAFTTLKLKTNRLINTSGSIGRRMACSSAVLGLYFSISESYLTDLADGRVPDDLCTMAAGFVSAGLFRSPRGPKAAAIAGTVGALAAAGLAGARQYFPSM